MKNKFLIYFLLSTLLISCDESSFNEEITEILNPSNLTYMDITDTRETKAIITATPTVETGGLIPTFEIINIKRSDGALLEDTYFKFISITNPIPVRLNVMTDDIRLDQNGNPITVVNSLDISKNGVITISDGHNLELDEYSFTIKVTTESEGKQYATTFEDGFKLTIGPLLPKLLIYSPKNQNLVFGSGSMTTEPILPNANLSVTYELVTHSDKLNINENTGVVSLSSNYNYIAYDTLRPTINVISKISGEVSQFEDVLTTIITDVPVTVPRENFYFFYPTLKTTGSFPTQGDGFSVQINKKGNGEDIFGVVDNSAGRFLVSPPERPSGNVNQTVLETQTFASGTTEPTVSWMVTDTQDLTPFQFGYTLSFNYYYQPAYQTYLSDGRTPTDLEVYISTDYTGGDIKDGNGTWTQVNDVMKCNRALGVSAGKSTGAPWGPDFIGTPYPGNQSGADPDNRKSPGKSFYGKWVKCSYDIPVSQISTKFTVAFKVNSYFTGTITNNAASPGRGGTYFLSDFNYKAAE